MNEKREKQKEEEKVNKDRKMRSETIILRPEVPLLERLSTYAASDAYPFHMPGHKRQVKMGLRADIKKLEENFAQSSAALPDGKRLCIRMSGGVAWYPEDALDLDTLKKYAAAYHRISWQACHYPGKPEL